MGLWPWTKRKKVQAAGLLLVRAKFDAAQTTPDNRKHWANADHLSADAPASPEVRRTLRNRARCEVANNSYARGIVLTLANDVIGTGPRLQMLADSADTNRTIEAEFAHWAKAVGLAEKLRTMRQALAQDGEAFALLFSNSRLKSPVKLDVRLIEADEVTSPTLSFTKDNAVDGIVLNEFGNPVEYHVLKQHPVGDATSAGTQYDRVAAAGMIDWFRADRPGRNRGLPDILPALPLFPQLRRYTLAVIAAAESAANIAVLMKTNAPAAGEAAEVDPMTEMELAPNMAVFTPEGWEPSQVKAEEPATTYDMCKREILHAIARCLNMPYNIAACNSSGYNHSSGRLDHQTYYKSIRVEQAHIEAVVLDRIFAAWLTEAAKVFGLDEVGDGTHQWFWDGHEHVDPQKDAAAQAQRLASHTTTLATEYARQGKDWETELRQRAKEVALMKELGFSSAQAAPQAPAANDKDDEDPEDKEDSRAAA